jgi:peroxiredoxin
MKKILVVISIIVIACNREQARNGDESKLGAGSSDQVLSSKQKSNPEFPFSNSQMIIHGNTLLDSAEWIVDNQNEEYDPDILFVDANWHIISQKESNVFRSSGDYGIVLLTGKNNKHATKLKLLSKKEKEGIPKDLLNAAIIRSKESVLFKYFNTECPDFSFTDLKGNVITKASLKGKIAVLNFWFLNCKGCRYEIPDLNDLVDQYKGNEDVVFVAPSTDSQEKLISYFHKQEFKYTKNKFNYIVATINYFKTIDSGPLFSAYPTHIIVNKEGKMTFIFSGTIAIKELLDQEIKKLLI